MGVVGNLPLAVAPAMGLNAYFAYSVVGFMGTGQYGVTYQQALTAVFIEGFIFVAISLLGVRTFLVEKMPRCIMLATSAGIGLFLAHIGLQTAEGIGLVTYNPATLVTLGGCSPSHRLYQFTIPMEPGALEPSPSTVCAYDEAAGEVSLAPGAFVASGNYLCDSAGVMRSPTMWLGIASGLLMVALMAKQVKGALMIGIIFGTVIAWIPTSGNMAAYIGKYTSVPGAVRRMEVFEEVVSLPDTSKTALEFDFSGFKNGQLWLALITFLYVDFFDSTGTLYTMATYLTHYIPNFVNLKTKSFERQLQAYCVDGLSSVVGATLGSSPLTCYIESAAGIREGARTGLSSLVIMLCFVISLFFSPLIAAIPP
jgi:adenine/guanine/hypoxanthine permease